jgi:hypothetical protein
MKPVIMAAPSAETTSNYFSGLLDRLPDSHGRLAFCIILAALPLIAIAAKTPVSTKIIAAVSTIGLFWWGWVLANTFGHPKNSAGRPLNNESLFGPGAPSTMSDLFHGTDILLLVIAGVIGAVAWKRVGGFAGLLSGFGIFSGVLIVYSLWQGLH